MTIHSNLLKSLADLGQGGVEKLFALEKAWKAHKAGEADEADVDAAMAALHAYGATAYVDMGLTLVTPETATGAAGEVLLSGGTDK